ncbi:MAG: OmpA family protein [Cytophagaceae bacterium]|nr:OmpA family protein [Cytophagaceae bacterium]
MRNSTLRFFALVFFITSVGLAFSQSPKSLFKEGHRLFKLEHYRKALPFLEKAIESEPNNAEAVFEAGVCYLHRYSKEKALEYILKAYTLDSNVSKYIHYWLGRAYHQNYQYDKAIQEYNIYKSNLKKSDQRRKDVEKHINQTNVARELTQDPENFRVFNLGPVINTLYSEHSPVTSKNDSLILFTSRRHDVTGAKEDQDGEFFEDIYQSKKLPNGEWTAPEHIHLNTSGHDASIQLLENDTKLLLYREAKGGDIFITEKEPGTNNWKEPQKFADINTSDFEADAFITADGKTAYFATNHYKKVGDLDIYYITKNDDGTWSEPKELQGKINTSEDEDAPFVSADGKTLYFSSRGHKNMGGFDVFKSTKDSATGNWSPPVNLGYPINTPDDDVYYYISHNGKKGYLSSYREGGYGEKDIYEIAPIPFVPCTLKLNACRGKDRNPLSYSVRSLKKTTKPIALSGKVENNKFTVRVLADNTYRIALYDGKDTVYAENFEVAFTEEENKTIEKNIEVPCPELPPDTTIADTVVKDTTIKPVADIVLNPVYFESGKADLGKDTKAQLDAISAALKKNPSVEIEISGHADAMGPDNLNQVLSEKRAGSTMNYLVSKGIKKDRLKTKGYGETRPMGDNETDEGRAKNRRVEFQIIKK